MISVLTFAVAFVASAINAMPIYRVLVSMKSRQTVSQYAPEGHQKKQGTPTMGGLIVAIGFLLGSLSFVIASSFSRHSTNSAKSFAIVGLFIGFAVIGFVDDYLVPRLDKDKRGLGWKQKILMQLVVAAAASWVLCGGFTAIWAATVFLILFFSNAYNFSDGLDALAGLLLIGLGGGLLAIAHMRDAVNLEPILVALVAAIIPFLYLNKPPAKLFMGDVGSLPIGAVLGFVVAGIAFPNDFDFLYTHPLLPSFGQAPLYYRPQPEWLIVAALILISGVMVMELVPVPLQILSVKLRKKRLFSFTPIHHAFERNGWTEMQVVGVFFGFQMALALIAIGITYSCPSPAVQLQTQQNKNQRGIKWHSSISTNMDMPSAGPNR